MSCRFEEEVLLLRDREGDPARRLVVEAHLARCTSCARIDEALELLGERLRAGDEAPLGVLARLRFAPRRRVLPLAAAAAALLAIAYLAWPGHEAPPVKAASAPPLAAPPQPERGREPPDMPPPAALPRPSIAALVAALDPAAPDYAARVSAVAARVRADGLSGSTALAALLRSADPRAALDIAREAPSPVLVEPLASLLDRPGAVQALAAAGAVRTLAGALEGPAAAQATEALVSIGGREAAAALERRIAERPATEVPALLDALARVDPAAAARVWAMGAASGADFLARHRERIVPELRRLLADDRCATEAARLLGEAKDFPSLEDLKRLAARPATVRAAATGLLSLGAFAEAFSAARRFPEARAAFDGARDAEGFLLGRVEEGPYAERRAALELLGRCGGPATVARLKEVPLPRNLFDAAAATLGEIGGEEAIEALDGMRSVRAVRRDVVRALGATGDPRAIPALQRFLGEDGLAGDLCASLACIHDAESAGMLADMALGGKTSEQAARALTTMPPSVVVPVLLERMGGRGRARELLVRVSGTDQGPRRESWKQWWDSRP